MTTDFQTKIQTLREKAFTDELKNNSLLYDVELDALKCNIDRTMGYENGQLLDFPIPLNDETKIVLVKFIKDFDAYSELSDTLGISHSTNEIQGTPILDYIEEVHQEVILYDYENNSFFYQGGDE